MICYRDMTFCNADCSVIECRRKLTDAVRYAAREWAERSGFSDVPIAVSDFSRQCPAWNPVEAK